MSRKADLESERESRSCPSKKLVYAANGPGGMKAMRRSSSLFLKANIKTTWRLRSILNSKSVNTETIRSGGHTKESFYKKRPEVALGSTVSTSKEKTRSAGPHYIKPNPDGTSSRSDVAGLHKLSTSKKNGRAAKFEGKRLPEVLPEVFYLNRCE